MSFNISEFSAQVNKRGLAKSNLFVAQITLGKAGGTALQNNMSGQIDTKELRFYCRSAALPEISIGTTPVRSRTTGPSEQRPSTFEYPPLSTVFMVDSDFAVLKFFHRWVQEIVNYDVEAGYASETPDGRIPYEFGYKDDYVCTLEITVFSENLSNRFYTYKFTNAFPISVGSIQTAWENGAEVMPLPVTFVYDELKVTGTDTGVLGQRNSGNSLFGFLSSLNTFGQAIRGLRRPRSIQDAVNLFTDAKTILGAFK